MEQCDHQYMAHLQDLFMTYLGKDVVLFTNNGCTNRMLECGTLPGMLSTLDFGGGYVKHSLASILLRGRSDKEGMQPGKFCSVIYLYLVQKRERALSFVLGPLV